MSIDRIAVVGGGTMGNGIAHVAAQSGRSVRLIDVDPGVLDRALETIGANLDRQIRKGRLEEEAREEVLGRIETETDLATGVADAELVVEAVPEKAELKGKIFRTLDEAAPEGAILASNTSSISITEIAAHTGRPERVIGMHFMNPVPVMKLVEVIRGLATSDETTEAVVALSREMGKTPVEVNDFPGFVSNRVLMPMINEAVFALMEGVAEPEPIDTVTDAHRRLAEDMLETMYHAPGIGLAATQVNVHQRMLVVDVSEHRDDPRVFINPVIVAAEGEEEMEEGCLSVPGVFDSVRRADRITVELYGQLTGIPKRQRVDLIVAHGSLGSPHFIFGEFDIPVITYIEFPSYADHGWDSRYPPTEGQRLIDKNMQMLSYYEVIKSERTLVPTEYARNMFPEYLRPRIVARFEGLDPAKTALREPAPVDLPPDRPTLGFAARDLSSAKGLDSFIATAAHLIDGGENMHFVVIGDPAATTYGYERVFLDRKYGKDNKVSFIDHLMRRHRLDDTHFTFTGKLPYAQFSDLVHRVDLFMYPVKFGSGNWGLVELLIRGRPVIAAARCYVPEIIRHGDNGLLVEDDKPQVWARAVVDLLRDDARRTALGENARRDAEQFHLPRAARDFMALFAEVIAESRGA